MNIIECCIKQRSHYLYNVRTCLNLKAVHFILKQKESKFGNNYIRHGTMLHRYRWMLYKKNSRYLCIILAFFTHSLYSNSLFHSIILSRSLWTIQWYKVHRFLDFLYNYRSFVWFTLDNLIAEVGSIFISTRVNRFISRWWSIYKIYNAFFKPINHIITCRNFIEQTCDYFATWNIDSNKMFEFNLRCSDASCHDF